RERAVIEDTCLGWSDLLRKEAARRADTHPVWAHIDKGFATGLGDFARQRFDQGVRGFQLSLGGEIERTARAIYEDLEKNPVALNTLRGTKFALEVGSIAGTIAAFGLTWVDLSL